MEFPKATGDYYIPMSHILPKEQFGELALNGTETIDNVTVNLYICTSGGITIPITENNSLCLKAVAKPVYVNGDYECFELCMLLYTYFSLLSPYSANSVSRILQDFSKQQYPSLDALDRLIREEILTVLRAIIPQCDFDEMTIIQKCIPKLKR